ncbi:MoxR-like ATPases [Lachnospiraceae bacterium KM106-2]|nr:MoxR-like ATPases [Lachnospiraceae bacterium KM106-2]
MENYKKAISEIQKVIIGKDEIIEKIFLSILSKGHILLDDIPGVGKTTLALAFRKVLGLDYKRIQFTPDVVPSDVIGYTVYHKDTGEFAFQPGAVMCNLLLADEINRALSRTQAALLEVMEERQITVDGVTHPVPSPFIVFATQNPIGSVGTQLLPQSQLDRFLVCLHMGYPDFQSQVNILRDRQTSNPLDEIQQIMTVEELLSLQASVRQVFVSDSILEYITHLCEKTRNDERIALGISPRGALALNNIAKANAFYQGRDYVIPEDILTLVNDVFSHRIILSSKARLDHIEIDALLAEILSSIPLPAQKH